MTGVLGGEEHDNDPVGSKKNVSIALLMIAITVSCGILYWIQPIMQQKETEKVVEMERELPLEIQEELDDVRREKGFAVTRGVIDETNRTIVLYVVGMSDKQLNRLQEKRVGNWTVTSVPDIEYIRKMETTRAELMRLEKDPKMQIAGFTMDVGPGETEVNMWVYNLTPENQALDGQKIHGWTIHIWKALTPTPTGTKG